MNKASAWILPITDTVAAAVGEAELVHVLPDTPALFEVPLAPPYCRRVLVWQRRIVPVMDLAARFQGVGPDSNTTPTLVGIFAYLAEGTGRLDYGALSLAALPRRREVSDAQACRLPDDFEAWRRYVNSGFRAEAGGRVIPILRLSRLFSSRPAETAVREQPWTDLADPDGVENSAHH
jgi:chemotaxis signal transduction protein